MRHAAKRKRPKRDAAVAVVCTFFLSVAVFGMAVLVICVGQYRQKLGESEEVSGTRGVRRDAWVLLHDDGALKGMWHVTADTGRRTIEVVVFPPEREVVNGTTVTTADEVFRQYGERMVTLIGEDETILLPLSGAAALVRDVSGNVAITLPQAVGTIPEGDVTLTPLQVAEVLRYDEWEQGPVGRAAVQAALATAFFERTLSRTNDTERAFEVLTDASESRLSIAQFAAVREEWETLCTDPVTCSARVAAGYTVGADTVRYVVTE